MSTFVPRPIPARGVAFLALLILIGSSDQVRSGAWVQSKRAYYLKLSSSYLSTTREFNYRGARLDLFEEHAGFTDGSFLDFNLTTYLEYGLSDRVTVVSNLQYKALRASRTGLVGGGALRYREILHTNGLADLSLSLRYALLVSPLALSLQGGTKMPLGYDKTPSNDGPPLGSGEVDGEVHVLAGKSLYPLPLYLSADLGYRRRGGRLHDEILYAVEAGYTAGRLLFKVGLDGVENTSTPPDIYGQTVVTPLPGGGGVLPDLVVGDQHVAKLSPALIYTLNPGLLLQADAFHVLAGENTLSGTTFALGIGVRR